MLLVTVLCANTSSRYMYRDRIPIPTEQNDQPLCRLQYRYRVPIPVPSKPLLKPFVKGGPTWVHSHMARMSPDAFVVRRAVVAAATLSLTVPTLHLIDAPADASTASADPDLQLFELCRTRRPSSWSADERVVVDALIEELVSQRQPWHSEMGRGKWRLAYLQRGFHSAPPPAFQLQLPFNEQFQIFGQSSVVNVAEVLGSLLEVRAAGLWLQDEPSNIGTPKRFRADIDQGALCGAITIGSAEKANIGRACVPLPLRGETYRVFEGEYLSPRLRIGQDINSGGARVVQVRVDSFSGRQSRR